MRDIIVILAVFSLSQIGIAFAEKKSKPKDVHGHEEHSEQKKHDDHEGNEAHEDHKEGESHNQEDHKGEDSHGHEKGHEEGEEAHDHGGEEEGHEEGGSRVGPDKGILEASEANGIKLSPEAIKNFELETKALAGSGPWTLPSSARLLAGEEVNLFRVREGFYKRIDFALIKKNGDEISVSSKDLKSGDSIVISGIGFLRIAEITAFGGAPEGHSH